MKLPTPYIIIAISIFHSVVSNDPSFGVCDVEGSGADDCPTYAHCCKQSKCDAIFNPNNNPDKRCCSKDERKKEPIPNDCMLCIECCDETERSENDLPSHCSKCRSCNDYKYICKNNTFKHFQTRKKNICGLDYTV